MPHIPVNLQNVAPIGSFTVFPPGTYTLRVKDCRQEIARSSGDPKLLVIYEIIDGPDGSPEHRGGTFPRSYSLKPTALGFLKRLLLAIGITDQVLAQAGGALSDEMIKGQVLRGRVFVRNNQGKDSNDLEEYVPDGTVRAANAPTGAPVGAPTAWPGNAPGFPSTIPAPQPPPRR